MPDLKISQLPVATTPLAGTELVPIVQGGTTDQTTVQAIMTSTVPSGTADGVLYLNGSKVATSGSALTFDGANLGVGAAPTFYQGSGVYVTRSGFATIRLNDSSAGGTAAEIKQSDSTGLILESISNRPIQFNVNAAEQMRLTGTGLGIGTTPTNKLTVNSGASTTTAQFTSTGSYVFLGLTNSGSSVFIGADNTGAFLVQTPGSGYSTKLLVDSSGNLGIGTISPTARVHAYSGTAMTQLTVDGTGGIKTGVNFANGGVTYGQIYFDNNAPYDMSVVQQYITGSLIFGTNSTERARIDSSGNFIQTAPTTPPTLSTNGTMVFNLTSNTNLRVSVRGSDGVTRVADLTLA